jgi:flagellar biosynthetic protein FliR
MELFRSETAHLLALLSTRLTGLFFFAPVFSSKAVPMAVRTALLLLFSFLMLPAAMGAVAGGAVIRATPGTLVGELVLGMVLGLGAALFVAAAESAGDMLAVQMGLSGANVLDPSSGTQMPVIGQFLGLFVMALILSTGGHLVLLETLRLSLDAFPVGAPLGLQEGIPATAEMLGTQFVLGLRFAAPVVAAMMIGNATLGVMAKTVPQLNVLMMAFPLQIAIGLFTLALSLPLIAGFFGQWPDHYTTLASGVLERFLLPEGGS